MLIRVKKSWDLNERDVTPEGVYVNRRTLMKGMAGLITGAGLAACSNQGSAQQSNTDAGADTMDTIGGDAPMAPKLVYTHNDAYTVDRPITDETLNTTYNNFYEYGSSKRISYDAQKQLKPRPWAITIDGMVDKPMTIDIDQLIGKMDLEERIYRHRCVETWAMVVPWIGFPLRKLVDLAAPQASAKYVKMETFGDPEMAIGIKNQSWYPWPYTEGVTMAEAQNDLPFLVVGAYGKVVANSMGAPIRLHLPWKYGFKSLKSIVRFTFTDQRPVSFWETINAGEYGFWANVNPEVPHPRWSQANEQYLGTQETVPTQLFNGYAEAVADLYTGIKGEQLYR